jgi:hypothetical protein
VSDTTTAEPELTTEKTARVAMNQVPGTPKSVLFRKIKMHAYIGETILLVGVMSIINLAFMPARPGFLGIEPNPFWAVILLMVTRYGFRAGLLSALLCSIAYMALLTARVSDEVIAFRDLMSWQYARPAVLFILVGVAGGMLVQRHKNRLERLEEEADGLRKENQSLKRGEEELRDVNVELANRVVGATDTLPMLYKYAKKLNNLDTEQILTVLTELVVEVTRAEQASVYRLEGKELPLHARNGKEITGPALQLEPGLFEEIVVKRETLNLHDLLKRNIKRKDLFLCGALTEGTGGKVLGVLAIEALEFLRYNPATIRLFSVIVDWACASLDKAAQYQDKPEEKRLVQAKTSMIRAERATMAPGMAASASANQASAAGDIEAQAKPDHAVAPAAKVVSGLPTALPEMLSDGPLAQAGTGAGLGDLLAGAESSLFAQMAEEGATGSTVDLEEKADPRDRALLQHMLSGELQIASAQGTPLAKLLTEIDGYMMARKGGGG